MNAYETMAAAIRFLDEQRSHRPQLPLVAARVGTSALNLQCMFQEWAGVRNADLLQCLSLPHARDLLRQGGRALGEAAGSGRDAVEIEVAAAGAGRDAGLVIRAGVAESPFGWCCIGDTPRGLCHLGFFDNGQQEQALQCLRAQWPAASIQRDDIHAAQLARAVFRGQSGDAPWRLLVRGTEFQVRVWRVLARVPAGVLVSYADVAAAAGHAGAFRATGAAVAANTLGYLIPCHRVVRETGRCGDFRWGRWRKRVMLAWEAGRSAMRAAGPGNAA